MLLPIPRDRRPARLVRLFAGLLLHGFSGGLLLQSQLGADPWDVFHQGLSRTFGLQVGTWVIIVGAVCLLLWIPLRQRVGLGTICNVVLIGLALNATLAWVPKPHLLAARIGLLAAAVPLYAVATACYIGAGLGPGPRDGLMTGIVARGHSVRLVRSGIELSVLALGWLLSGTVGVGTVVFAVLIGPMLHWALPAFTLRARLPRGERAAPALAP